MLDGERERERERERILSHNIMATGEPQQVPTSMELRSNIRLSWLVVGCLMPYKQPRPIHGDEVITMR